LEQNLRQGAAKNRVLALAALLRKTTIGELGFPEISQVLQQLAGDSRWVRAEALSTWLGSHAAASREEAETLAQLAGSGAGESPRDVASLLLAAYHLNPALWSRLLGDYCDPAAQGESRLRCWRVLGALAEYRLPVSLTEELSVFLPKREDDDWKLFLRSFPELALKTEKNWEMQ
jgi:hypothetical protein